MHSQKLHILNIPELDKIIIEIKNYFNYEINYFNEKKALFKNIEEDISKLNTEKVIYCTKIVKPSPEELKNHQTYLSTVLKKNYF